MAENGGLLAGRIWAAHALASPRLSVLALDALVSLIWGVSDNRDLLSEDVFVKGMDSAMYQCCYNGQWSWQKL